MYQIPCNKYWNTWNSKSPAIMSFLPVEFHIVIGANSYAEDGKYTNFPFSKKIKLFEHHPDGNYCRLQVEHGGTILQIEYIKSDDYTVTGRIKSIKQGEWGLRFQTLISFGFEQKGEVECCDGSFKASMRSYQIAIALKDKPIRDCYTDDKDALGKAIEKNGYYTPIPTAVDKSWYSTMYNLEETPEIIFAVSVTNDYASSQVKASKALGINFDQSKKDIMGSLSTLSKGDNISSMESMREVMAWNTIADYTNQRVFTSLTRFWIDRKFGGWFIWLDDILMHGLINSFAGDWVMARNCMKAALDNTTPEGNLACLMSEFTEWVDRSQPPITSFIIYKYYQLTGDRQLLEEVYPILLKANLWWYDYRDGNANGILEYGSSQVGNGHFNGTKLAAKDEAAMDNSPMYDSAVFIKDTNTINMEDIALNSLLALDGECLSLIAKIVGDEANSKRVLEKANVLKAKIDLELWDEKNGLYANKHWDNGFVCPSPTSFYPLAAGIPEGEKVDRLISHIFNEEEFWTDMPMPSIWLKEESVNDNVYWRGRSWPPLNFITYIGLKRYGKNTEATKLLTRIMHHYTRLWENEKSCYENHNTFTGEGNDSVDTDPYYGWGALYPLMWIMEHIDLDPWNGFHFGSPSGSEFEIIGLKMADGIYALNCDEEGTVLLKDGTDIVRTDAVGRFTQFHYSDHYISITVPKQKKDCKITLGTDHPIKVICNEDVIDTSNVVMIPHGKSVKIELFK